MKPYDDETCECHKIEAEINAANPGCDWNCDACCDAWNKRSEELNNNDIEFEAYADENYGCTCPTCGRMVCGWCV